MNVTGVNVTARLARVQRRVRVHRMLRIAMHAIPWIALAAVCAWRWVSPSAAVGVVASLLVGVGVYTVRAIRRIDRAWLVRALDRHDPGLQDSSDLLFADDASFTPVQMLQRDRVRQRLATQSEPDLREPLPWRVLSFGTVLASAAMATAWWWPAPDAARSTAEPSVAPAVVRMQALLPQIEIVPPSYTGLAPRRVDALAAEAPEGSVLRWSLAFALEPRAVRLRFVDGGTLELAPVDGAWRGERRIDASTLYRIELDGDGLPDGDALQRIDIVPDRAPRLTVQAPERTLTVLDAAQPRWSLALEAEDDHGLGTATLELTLAQGSGEQVTVSERRIALRGDGDARRQRYTHRIDLGALGFVQGDDLIARVRVADRREPTPNVAQTAAFILRWPAETSTDGSGVEGLVQQAMPAYFRSQRQIILDTEALLAARGSIDDATLLARSDALGVDQRILRLRYGQFLGEEAESNATPPPDAGRTDQHDAHEAEHAHANAAGHDHEGEHDHAAPPSQATAQDLMAAAGHLHDLPEAATLLDPATRALLRGAIDAMWQAERELRGGALAAALPHEYRALDFIKRVQQADRIYLARVGLELPALDPARRLTGDRGTLAARRDPLAASEAERVPERAWQLLVADVTPDLTPLRTWLAEAPAAVADPLALLADVDALQRDPACAVCRARLADRLWPVLVPPAPGPAARPAPDPVEHAWLDAFAPASEHGP